MTWAVYLVHYQTHEEIALVGDKPRERVASGLTLEAALAMVEALGFGHSAHPESRL